MKYCFRLGNQLPLVLTLVPRNLPRRVLENRLSLVLSLLFLIPVGLLFRRFPPFEMALVYTVAALLSPEVGKPVLAHPCCAVGVFLNIGFLLWVLGASVYLAGAPRPDGLSVPFVDHVHPPFPRVVLDGSVYSLSSLGFRHWRIWIRRRVTRHLKRSSD